MKKFKRKSDVWDYFYTIKRDDKLAYECKFCKTTYTKNASRMRNHLIKCNDTPAFVKEIFVPQINLCPDQPPQQHQQIISNDQLEVKISTASVASSESSSQPINPKINHFFESLDKHDNEELDRLLAKAIFSMDSPLSLVENEYWKILFNKLKPTYKLPTRYQMCNNLLENEYHSVKEMIKAKISGSNSLALQCSSQTNVSVINFIVTTPEPIFYKTIGTSPEFICKKIEEILLEVGIEKFHAIIIDNDPIMIKATSDLTHKYPQLALYICAADILNILFSDILYSATVARFEQVINELLKEINNCQILRANLDPILSDNSPSELLKPMNKTFFDSLKNLLSIKNVLQNFIRKGDFEKNLSKKVIYIIINEDFWNNIQKIHDLFYPILQWITVLKSDTSRLSLVVECYKELHFHFEKSLPESPLTNSENASILRVFQKRKKMSLKNIHFAANMLDPRYNGENLNTEEQLRGMEFIDEQVTKLFDARSSKEIIQELAEYRAKEGFFGNSYVKKSALNLDSVIWWKGTCFNSKLGKIAVNILQMPPTNVAKDNSHNVIHMAEQNSLTLEKAGKLTFVSNNLKFFKGFDCKSNWSDENNEDPLNVDEYQKHFSFENDEEIGSEETIL